MFGLNLNVHFENCSVIIVQVSLVKVLWNKKENLANHLSTRALGKSYSCKCQANAREQLEQLQMFVWKHAETLSVIV